MQRIRFVLRERRATLLAAFVALLLATVNAVASASASVGPAPTLGSDSVQLSSSRSGSILPPLSNMKPGDRVSGDITMTNAGGTPGTLWLTAEGLKNTRGQGGGDLSHVLRLTVTDPRDGSVAYDGPLAGLSHQDLGALGASQARAFRFTVTFPTAADSSLQGGRVAVDFEWTLVAGN